MAKPKIFVSHSTLDTPFASKMVHDLNTAGAQAWIDNNDLGAGDFQQRIDDALLGCEWFLLVLTHNALVSKWVQQEVGAAIILKHQGQIHEIIFVKADSVKPTELRPLWRVFNVFDATADYTSALNRTLKAVGIVVPPVSKANVAQAASEAQNPFPQPVRPAPSPASTPTADEGKKTVPVDDSRYLPEVRAFLVYLRSKGVTNEELLARMLSMGQGWILLAARRLKHFERTGLAPKSYQLWCEHAYDGAYDWIDNERLKTTQS